MKKKCKVIRNKITLRRYDKADVMKVNMVPVFDVDFLKTILRQAISRETEEKLGLFNL